MSRNRKISLADKRGKPDSLLWALNHVGLKELQEPLTAQMLKDPLS